MVMIDAFDILLLLLYNIIMAISTTAVLGLIDILFEYIFTIVLQQGASYFFVQTCMMV